MRTVDFMSVYPTLCELCGLDIPKHVEGPSIKGLLAKPDAAWDRPAVTTRGWGNHSVRSERWRYIRYDDGSEELYDETSDPMEWTNVASKSEYAAIKAELARWLPKDDSALERHLNPDSAKTLSTKDKKAKNKKKKKAEQSKP